MMTVADVELLRSAAHGERDPGALVVGYDRRSDTLAVHFFGRGIPAVSVPVGDGERDLFYVRVDPTTNRPVGLQIEGFLAGFAAHHPELAVLRDIAELRGIGRDEIEAFQERLARDRADALIARFLDDIATG